MFSYLYLNRHGEAQLKFISSPILVTPSTISSTKPHQLLNPRNTKLPNIAKQQTNSHKYLPTKPEVLLPSCGSLSA